MKAIVAAVLGVASLAGAPALAADITLEVPLLIENVPSAMQVHMYCSITSSTRGVPGTTSNIVRAERNVPITDGGFNGIITFEFSAPSLADADGYSCAIGQLSVRGTDGRIYAISPDSRADDLFATATGLTVLRKVMRISGPLR